MIKESLLGLAWQFGLLGAAHFLRSVLPFLPLLPSGGLLCCEAIPDKTVLGLELLCYSEVVVDETKSRAPSTTKLCLETKKEDCLGILDLVHLGQLLLHLGLGDVGATLMDQINNELLPLKEAIVHKLSGTDGALCHDGTGKEADGALRLHSPRTFATSLAKLMCSAIPFTKGSCTLWLVCIMVA